MKVKTQYNDLIGTVAVDLQDEFNINEKTNLKKIALFFGIDQNKFIIKGIILNGLTDIKISLICEDKETKRNIMIDINNIPSNELNNLFKRFKITLFITNTSNILNN